MLSLTALELIGPEGYLRYVFPFEPGDERDYDMGEVTWVLGALTGGADGAGRRGQARPGQVGVRACVRAS